MTANDYTLKTVQAFLGAMGQRDLEAIVGLFAQEVIGIYPEMTGLRPGLEDAPAGKA